MKKHIAVSVIILGFLFMGIGYALASTQHSQRVVYNGRGFSCSAKAGTVYCATGTEPSYGISYDHNLVMVMKFYPNGGNRVVFKRWQP